MELAESCYLPRPSKEHVGLKSDQYGCQSSNWSQSTSNYIFKSCSHDWFQVMTLGVFVLSHGTEEQWWQGKITKD